MSTREKSERRQRSCYPTPARELLARQFTSIAVITSWDFKTLHLQLRVRRANAHTHWLPSETRRRGVRVSHNMQKLTIAIDGPAGSGKSSLARRVASMLGYLYMDSGGVERAVA